MSHSLVSVLAVVGLLASPLFAQEKTVNASAAAPLTGVWRLNPELSDPLPEAFDGTSGRGREGGTRGGRGGGFGRGGGRGGFGRGGGRGAGAPDETRVRQMEAVRDLVDAPERLTITTAGAMVIITAGDGRTTRLMADGSEVKDESTKVTRKTRWDSGRLVSEISGLVRGKVTETYAADRESSRLTVTVSFENLPGPLAGRRGAPPDRDQGDPERRQPDAGAPSSGPPPSRNAQGSGRTFTRVYEPDRP